MVMVRARRNETIDQLLARFDKAVKRNGLHKETRRREFFQSKSIKRRQKRNAELKRIANQRPDR